MQVKQPLSRLEVVAYVHSALYSVKNPLLEVCTDPTKDFHFQEELPEWDIPNVAGFTWKGNSNPVVYARDVQSYWERTLREGKPEQVVRHIRSMQYDLDKIAMRPDCGLSFITGDIPDTGELGDQLYGSQESFVLQQVARFLLSHYNKITRAAITSSYGHKMDYGKLVCHVRVHEIK